MATRRTGWRGKSAGYRSRLIGAGKSGKLSGSPMTSAETRAYWQAGGDLRGGRSHVPHARGAAPTGPAERFGAGLAQPGDYEALREWRSSGGGQAWIPDQAEMGWDTAAILSQIDIPPDRWKSVEFQFQRDGMVVMIVTPKRGYPRTVFLPDAESASEVGRMLSAGDPFGGLQVNSQTQEGTTGSGNIGGKARIAA